MILTPSRNWIEFKFLGKLCKALLGIKYCPTSFTLRSFSILVPSSRKEKRLSKMALSNLKTNNIKKSRTNINLSSRTWSWYF